MKRKTAKQLLEIVGAQKETSVCWLLNNELADERSKEIVLDSLRRRAHDLEKAIKTLTHPDIADIKAEFEGMVNAYKEIIRRGEKAKVRLTSAEVLRLYGH